VALEMQGAIVGMRRVLKANGRKGKWIWEVKGVGI
jgi:hypothetical protein